MSSHFRPVELAHASRLLNHGPTVMVTSAHGERRNVMSAAWSMPVEFNPPRVAVVIDKHTYTRELVHASGAFGLVVPGRNLAALVHAVGSESGRERDKFIAHGLQVRTGPVLGLPLLEAGAVAWLECRLLAEPHTEEAYDTCFAEVVSAAADERVFAQGRWHLNHDNAALHTLHYLGGGQFVAAGDAFQVPALG
ncbi:MAG: hypothetical protein RI907_1089 [Pseudomonadota bacterium]|jgi:flavin reductase (DIM6/NTAB) family NADH-FMN oxidoreductase RutF